MDGLIKPNPNPQSGMGRVKSNLASRVKKGRMAQVGLFIFSCLGFCVLVCGLRVPSHPKRQPTQSSPAKKTQKAAADATLARVTGALDYSGFGACDMVIEAVIEVGRISWGSCHC